jgi:DNA modification methylase
MSVIVHHGDSRDVLKTLADASVDSVVCDPPYALTNRTPDVKGCVDCGRVLGGSDGRPAACPRCGGALVNQRSQAQRGFMGKKWDTGETAFDPAFWVEVMRVLKPGGHLIAFSGTRTYHRLACAIEDAGFEMRDMIAWLYGSGFPKSHDVSKGIDKSMGLERAVLSEGKAVKRMIPGADQHKGGWEKTDGREFVPTVTAAASAASAAWEGWGTALKPALEPIVLARKPLIGTVAGNVLAHGTGALNIAASRIGHDEPVSVTARTAPRYSGLIMNAGKRGGEQSAIASADPKGRWPANVIHDGSDEVVEAFPETASNNGAGSWRTGVDGACLGHYGETGRSDFAGDSGSAARFFYSSKADAADRCGSKHPTVKPIDLMAYLVRLVTPPGGVVLDPFAGSGSTGMAYLREGFDAILIEREAQYVADIHRRIAHVSGEDAPLFAGSAA